jgi:hypothetical protein
VNTAYTNNNQSTERFIVARHLSSGNNARKIQANAPTSRIGKTYRAVQGRTEITAFVQLECDGDQGENQRGDGAGDDEVAEFIPLVPRLVVEKRLAAERTIALVSCV